ncbi:MAG: sigma 54-interacting transcriptional regulator, partial [Myxococcota bacterium]
MRTTSIIGFLAVLYLLADAASAGRLAPAWFAAAAAILLALASLAPARAPAPGHRRARLLSLTLGVLLASMLGTRTNAFGTEIVASFTAGLSAGLIVDLARPARALRTLYWLIFAAASVVSALVVLPTFELFGSAVLTPSGLRLWPYAVGGSLVLAVLHRLRHRTVARGGDWALAALLLTLAAGSVGFRSWVGGELRTPGSLGLFALLALFVAYGHLAEGELLRAPSAPPALREALALLAPLMGFSLFVQWLLPTLDASLRGTAATASFVAFAAVWLSLRGPINRLLAPSRGRLLEATQKAREALEETDDLLGVGEALLAPLRDATGTSPTLYTLAPARKVEVSAAGTASVERASVADAFEGWLAMEHQSTLVRDQLEARTVREIALRPVLGAMDAEEATVAIAIGEGDGIEGLLLLRGASTLADEELNALERVARATSSRLSLIGGRDRALTRVGEMAKQLERAHEDAEALDREQAVLRSELSALNGEGQGSELVVYSAAMARVDAALNELAAAQAHAVLIAEAGVDANAVAQELHRRSARTRWVSGRGADAVLLFGEGMRPGLLRLATGGTLFLEGLPALSQADQLELADTLAQRQGRARGEGASPYPVDVCLIAAAASESALNTMHPELLARLGRRLHLPPLRQRSEDLASLILLATAEGCASLGRAPMGLDQSAIERLVQHPWPGNEAELRLVLAASIRGAEGPRLRAEDLWPLVQRHDPLEGTLREVEARVLR